MVFISGKRELPWQCFKLKESMRGCLLPILFFITIGCEDENQSSKILDADGNVYTSVKIGSQMWMVENLKTTRFSDGTTISNVTDNASWSALQSPAYSWYNNSIDRKTQHGALYNWFAVNSGKLCPDGWHVPSDEDWSTLITYLDPAAIRDTNGKQSASAGGAMKSTETSATFNGLWINPNEDASNSSGFTALPGGLRNKEGQFINFSVLGCWWSSTTLDGVDAWYRYADYANGGAYRFHTSKNYGLSCRCIRD
jgi:uncharacterized protein (TIGR02145 family)